MEVDASVVLTHDVLQQEEFDVAFKRIEEFEEVRIAGENGAQRALAAGIMAPDALHSYIKSILYARVAAAGSIDGHLAVDLVFGEDHHAANCVTEAYEPLETAQRKAFYRCGQCLLLAEGRHDGVARELELTYIRVVMQIHARSGVNQVEQVSIW